jgi:hypothetical protein
VAPLFTRGHSFLRHLVANLQAWVRTAAHRNASEPPLRQKRFESGDSVATGIGGRARCFPHHTRPDPSHGDLDVAQAGPSLHFNVDQKKLPPAVRIAAVQAIVALAIGASFAIVLAAL